MKIDEPQSPDSRFNTFHNAFMAANRGDYEQANSYLSKSLSELPFERTKRMWDCYIRNSTIVEIKNRLGHQSRGSTAARQTYQIFYTDGQNTTLNGVLNLYKISSLGGCKEGTLTFP